MNATLHASQTAQEPNDSGGDWHDDGGGPRHDSRGRIFAGSWSFS